MTRHRSNIWGPVLLLLVCTALAWVIYGQLAAAPSPEGVAYGSTATAPTTVPELPPEPQFSMRPMEDFQVILERPIFSPSRRPPLVESVEAHLMQSGVAFTLKGILIDENERIALFRTKSSDKVVRLREGDEIEGWTLVQIEADHVTLARGEIESVLQPTYDQHAPTERALRNKNPQKGRQQQPSQTQTDQSLSDPDQASQ